MSPDADQCIQVLAFVGVAVVGWYSFVAQVEAFFSGAYFEQSAIWAQWLVCSSMALAVFALSYRFLAKWALDSDDLDEQRARMAGRPYKPGAFLRQPGAWLIYTCYRRSLADVENEVLNSDDVNIRLKGDITPLGGAIHGSRMEVAKLLLEHGANVSQADLLHACTRGHPDIVQLMLSYGTNVNKPSGTRPPRIWPRPFHNYWMNVKLWEPNTRPLHAACSSTSPNAPATIELLIALGAEAIGEYNRNLPRLPIVKEAHVRWLQSHLWVAGDCWRVELSGRWASSLRYRKELNQTMTTAPLLLACLQACIPMVDKDADLDTAAPWSQIIKWDYLVHRASHDEHHHDDIT
eukprot:TRINITY_DN11435_c0_g1_i17.p2 TRINITY_DN11435_c0_g1~~TRINITY_DN11435_c0_g1_i17.p2  ORF type:complete len:349 (+),score=35.65 TRINITY_DN11435_c0_g1_i17:1510-2556(+)